MSSIDERIVQMQFDNDQFMRGIKETSGALDGLTDSLMMDGADKGLNNVQKAADSMNLQNVSDGVDRIAGAFSALGVIGINVLSRIAQEALTLGGKLFSNLINPLIEGGRERALSIEQAKFQFRGLGLDIEATMAEAKAAVLGTAFGLDSAASAAAQLGASGIFAGQGLQNTLRGIAGVAAQTNSSFDDIAHTFEKVAGNGRLMGDDLLSLSSRGFNAAATIGKAMGKTEQEVREMVSDGKISFKIFSDAMFNAFGENAARANETFTGALANMRAALRRMGAAIQIPLLEAQRKQFNALGPVIDKISAALTPLFTTLGKIANINSDNTVKFLEGLNFDALAALAPHLAVSLGHIFFALQGIAGAIGDGFKQIFPGTTVEQMEKLGKILEDVTQWFRMSGEETENLTRTFAGFFALLDIGWQIIKRVVGVIAGLFGFAEGGKNGVLEFTGNIGDLLVKLDKFIKYSPRVDAFFAAIEAGLRVPMNILKAFGALIGWVGDAINDLVTLHSLAKFGDDTEKRFSGLIHFGEALISIWHSIVSVFRAVIDFLNPFVGLIVGAVETMVDHISHALDGMSFDDAIKVINTGLFGALVLGINGFFGHLGGALMGNGVAIVTQMKLIFGGMVTNLKALEMNLNAKTLLVIAQAVALLTASAVALSLVDADQMLQALGVMTIFVKGLLVAMATLTGIGVSKKLGEMFAVSVMLQTVAGAILTLTAAIAILGALPLPSLIAGVSGVVVVLAAMVGAIKLMSNVGPGAAIGAAAMILVATSLLIASVGILAFAGAMKIFSTIEWGDIWKSMILLAGSLGILAIGLTLMIASGPGALALIVAAVGILALSGALKVMSMLSWEEVGKSLVLLAGALVILAGGLVLMTASIPGSAALLIASVALLALGLVLKMFASLSWDEVGRGLVVLGGSLLILAVGLTAMIAAVPGALALLIAAPALILLAVAMKILSTLSWDQVGVGLGVLAAALGIIALAGLALIPALPGLLGFAAAMVLLGIGALAAGIGISLFAAGLAVLGTVGQAALALIGPAIIAFAKQIPLIAQQIGIGIGMIAMEIIKQAPVIILAIVTILLGLIGALEDIIPPLIEALTVMIVSLVEALIILIPLLVDAGLKIIGGILEGVANNIGKITEQGIAIMVNFLNALASKLPDIITAGGTLVLSFITGIGDYVRNNASKFVDAGSKLFRAIVDGVALAIERGGSDLRYAGQRIGTALINGAKNALGINSPSKVFRDEIMGSVFEGVEDGNDKNIKRANEAGAAIGDSMIAGVSKAISGVAAAVNANVDVNPTISPVLDLSAVKRDAAGISGMLNGQGLSVSVSRANAEAANTGYEENQRLATDADGTPINEGDSYTYNQYNNSPKALSAAEIYRQTKSQLAVKKGDAKE